MPFVIALWPLVTGIFSALGLGAVLGKISNSTLEDIEKMVYGWVVQQAAAQAFNLDRSDPFSDASLAGAISERLNVPLRSVRDRAMIEEDLLAYAATKIYERSGVRLSNLKSADVTKRDLIRHAGSLITLHTGIPLADITDREQTIADVKEWGLSQVYAKMGEDAQAALTHLGLNGGVDVEGIVNQVNATLHGGGTEPLSTKKVVMAMLHSQISQQIARVATRAALTAMKSRRQLQMQAASMRFRERNGHRMKYIRLGSTESL